MYLSKRYNGFMKKQKKLIIGNWKMNPGTHTEASLLFKGISKQASKYKNVDIVLCPPYVFLDKLSSGYSGTKIAFGGQNLYFEESGAHTGEVSASQLYSVGADYVIIGHSERRAMGETDIGVQNKIKIALSHSLTPIVCIGESDRDSHGKYLMFLRKQITTALKGIKIADVNKVVIAYEPIWAIGKTGKDAITPQKLHETSLFIRRVLLETYTKKVAMDMKILYGGSVKPNNAEELLRDGEVLGFLIGGASLDAENFTSILETANNL